MLFGRKSRKRKSNLTPPIPPVPPVSEPQIVSMNCVYASPERMDGSSFAPRDSNPREYPFIHAQGKMQAKFCRICGTPLKIPNGTCESCGINTLLISNPEETMGFCKTCGNSLPISSSIYCPYCGRRFG